MWLNLVRSPSSASCTFGKLSIDGLPECLTLERPEVQIPAGTYSIEMTDSLDLTCDCPDGSLSHLLPLLDGVPGRSAIRIHSGNWPRDSEGCILVGHQIGQDMILQSRAALDPLVQKIQLALDSGQKVLISIA